jgi:hypothetical protein
VVEYLHFTLRAWDKRGLPIPKRDFLERLSFVPGDLAVVEDGPGAARVRLVNIAFDEFSDVDTSEDAGSQSEAFAAAVRDGLMQAAKWLSRQPNQMFEDLRAKGHETDVFVGAWITDDQFDLDLPPEFSWYVGDWV